MSVSLRASTRVSSGFTPLRHSSPSFGSRQVCSHSNPSEKIKVSRRCTPQGDPTNQLPYALRVYSTVDSHICQIPWSVFQDGSNGEPTIGEMPKHAGGARCLPQSGRRGSMVVLRARDLASPPIHVGPHPESIGRPARHLSTSDRGASPAPIRFPPDNFKHFLTLFSNSFSCFPCGSCSLSFSRKYLVLDGIYPPFWAAFPNNPTRRQSLVVRYGPVTIGISPCPASPSRGLGPDPPLITLLQTTIRTTETPDSKAGCSRFARRY